MKKRGKLLITGTVMILCGIALLFLGSLKTVEVIVNGGRRTVRTIAGNTIGILNQAGIPYGPGDRVRPGLTDRIGDGGRISLDRTASVSLRIGNSSEPLKLGTWQRFSGNMLLDAGLRLYPGDRIFWKDTEIGPGFSLAGISEIELRLVPADRFTLVTESDPSGRPAYGSGATVADALLSAGISLNPDLRVSPDSGADFTPGMTIEVLPLRQLTVSSGGKLITARNAGANVGEALARMGMPLMGSDISIPAAGEPVPEDGRILIVPVSESFSMEAEVLRRRTEWSAGSDLALDETRVIEEGKDGLQGTFTRVRTENGEQVLSETSPETVLAEPKNEKREYGTKISVRTLDTPDGPVEYYRSVTVYATSYSPCRSGTSSCITGTASGMKVGKGIAAVTSDWYNQFGGQTVYVPGYGKAVIADVGGGIPGKNWIDLAYEDDTFEPWSKETTLYFLTPVPADMVWVLQ